MNKNKHKKKAKKYKIEILRIYANEYRNRFRKKI